MLKNGRIHPGTPITVSCAFEDLSGALVDPDSVTFKTLSPTGRERRLVYGEDAEVQRKSAGVYLGDVTPDEAGRWRYRWESTGNGTATVHEDSFIVLTSRFSPYPSTQDYS